jgi:uncharacterized membrane protein YqhA
MLKSESNGNIVIGMVLLIAFFVRGSLIVFAQKHGADWATYERFAENLLQVNVFSQSPYGSSSIVPSTGGYFPGFPAFVALVWSVFDKSTSSVLWAQLLLYILALYWLLISLRRLTGRIQVIAIVGVAFAISPLTVGWSRFPLTESLAITASILFLAEVINSLALQKLRACQLAAALVISVYVRPDTILMALVVPIISFSIYRRKRDAITQLVIVALLASIPVGGWLVRNVLVGSAPLSFTEGDRHPFKGYREWVGTWATHEYERDGASLMYPERAKFYTSKFLSENEIEVASVLVAKLGVHDVSIQAINSIDEQFKAMAEERQANAGSLGSAQLYIAKGFNLLFSPFAVWGLPVDVTVDKGEALKAAAAWDVNKLNEILAGQMWALAARLLAYAYQILLFLLFFIVVLLAAKAIFSAPNNTDTRSPDNLLYLLLTAATLLLIARLSFFVAIGGLESRYLVEAIPWIECSLGLALARMKSRD